MAEKLSVIEKYEDFYKERELENGAFVTRLAPSPTGFIHLGNLFTANINYYLAKQTKGVFYLRIEDTDTKREVENAKNILIKVLDENGIQFDEGATLSGDKGKYGPYEQSKRGEIYLDFVNELLKNGSAYKCYLKEDEIEKIREKQLKENLTPGIYKGFSPYRDSSNDELLSAKRENMKDEKGEFVIRLKSKGEPFHSDNEKIERVEIKDAIRGKLCMPRNFLDIVLIKKDGLPTYHFAHVVDDYLMKTTHVIRGEEWLSSLPIHIELNEMLKIKPPIYAHTAVIMKNDNGNKRKLSKRKDPESSLAYYKEQGFLSSALKEYLFTITNSNFEIWRKNNKDEKIETFPLSFEKMSKSGILFDLEKLKDISKNHFALLDVSVLKEKFLEWAKEYKNEFYSVLKNDETYLEKVLSIGRNAKKVRKDYYSFAQMAEKIEFFFKEFFNTPDLDNFSIKKEDFKSIIDTYIKSRDFADTKEEWFEKVKKCSEKLGYITDTKEYKNSPEKYKGSIADFTLAIRYALTGMENSPDIFEIENILGKKETKERLELN